MAAKMHHVHTRKQRRALGPGLAALAAMAIIFACLTASASAEEGAENQAQPIPLSALGQAAQGQEAMPSLTDPQAAAQLPHQNLDRTEALNLMETVFGPVLQSPAGPFDDLQVQRFLSDNVAVIAAGDQPASSGAIIGETAAQAGYEGPTLIESTLPLRVNGDSPADVVDLDLERTEEELQPANPLAEVSIPQELGEGIEIPGAGIEVGLSGAPADRVPSIIDQSVAAYPNVAEDTAFAVAPTPTGFETMSVLQSADAPTSQTFDLNLPLEAALEETPEGGAIVTQEGETLLEVQPPSAIDATGAAVPVSMTVSGNSLRVQASPQPEDKFPILVDPKYQWFGGIDSSFADWSSESNASALTAGTKTVCEELCMPSELKGKLGLDVAGKNGGSVPAGGQATWSLYVPRYFSDIANYGTAPQSFVTSMFLSTLAFWGPKDTAYSPALVSGVWDQTGNKYTSVFIHGGNAGELTNLTTTYTFGYGGDENAKRAIAAQLYAGEAHVLQGAREAYVGTATVEFGDSGKPSFGTPTPAFEGWVNSQPTAPIGFTASDAGLGVKSMVVVPEGLDPKTKGVWTTLSCKSTPSDPCPRNWKSSDASMPIVKYDPSVLPQGEDPVELIAYDVAENATKVKLKEKVDRTAPQVTLSGSMTEQATLGTRRPSYILKVASTDGTEAAPQSGVAKTEIKVDGQVVDSTNAGCATRNCAVTREWTLNSLSYTVGKHTIVAKSTDGVGLTTEKTLTIEVQRDTTSPTITELGGALMSAPEGWVEQKSYGLSAKATDADFGVTSLVVKIDGKAVKTVTQSCTKGACGASLSATINMAGYTGGEHPAELIATDGAGNAAKKTWTINVDPKGSVPTGEAIETLEAVDSTGETQIVAPSVEIVDEGEYEEGNNPGLEQNGSELESTGTGATTVMTTSPSEGVTIESAEGNIEIEPVAGGSLTASEIASGAVAVSGGSNVDTAVRPIYDGLMTYQSIRDATAPQSYSWDVSLRTGQTLKAVDAQHVAIFNEDGTQALAITAEPSHDATGKAVPTELSVSGNVLTLIVKHVGGGFVYPVVGGPAFQASYVEPIVYTPPPPPEEKEPTPEEMVGTQTLMMYGSAPQFSGCPPEDACASSGSPYKTYAAEECVQVPVVGCTNWDWKIKGFFYYNGLQAWMSKRQPRCEGWTWVSYSISEGYCKWVGPDHQKYGNGYHITSQTRYFVHSSIAPGAEKEHYITVRMFGDGFWKAHQTSAICNPSRPEC